MHHFNPENPWGMDMAPVDHDTVVDDITRKKTPAEEMAAAAEIPLLDELAENGTPSLPANVIAFHAAKSHVERRSGNSRPSAA